MAKLQKKGFTLIELMVIIVIIGVLAGLAINRYRLITMKTKISEAVVFMKYIQNLAHVYYNEKGVLPTQDGTWLYYFDSDPGNTIFGSSSWFEQFHTRTARRLEEMGLEQPSGDTRFWYQFGWGFHGEATLRVWGYAKTKWDWPNFPEEQCDKTLEDVYIVCDNDGQVYIWGVPGIKNY
ncbi:MAG: type II secretion system protein [Candidatus Zixiibacteriota bacterium]